MTGTERTTKQQHLEYLDGLKAQGIWTSQMHAFLERDFDISYTAAKAVVWYWKATYGERMKSCDDGQGN